MNGKEIRLSRILPFPNRRGCIVPMDHSVTLGPIAGLEKCYKTISAVFNGGATAVVLHKGMLSRISKHVGLLSGNYIMHISASTCLGQVQSDKVLVGTVEEAIKLGAMAVSIHINLGSASESAMLRDFGMVSQRCNDWGMPLLAMMYVSGQNRKVDDIAHAARVAQEVGADLVKLDYPGSAEGVRKIVSGVDIPILIAGGARIDKVDEFLGIVNESLFGGASGISAGRNIFQHEQVRFVTEATCKLLQGIWRIDECIGYLESKCFPKLELEKSLTA